MEESGRKTALRPLEVNGITAVTLGTVAWVIALGILVFSRNWLDQTGRSHWIWISVSGIILGLLGYRYSTRRAKRLGLSYSKKIFASKTKEPDQSQLVQDFE
jgi:hypothetical protein